MSSITITGIVILLTFFGGWAGLKVQNRLAEHNSVEKSRDMIGSVLGLLTLLLALVLGTLIGNTYFFSTNQQSQLQTMMTSMILLDKSLAEYGPEAKPLRDAMKESLQHIYDTVWVKGDLQPEQMTVAGSMKSMAPFEKALLALDAKTPEQKAAQASALARYATFQQTRILMSMQLAVPFSKALLGIVIVWAGLLFFGYGLLSQHNTTTLTALAFGSICVGFAIFIIVELGEPYSGLFRLSPAAILQAIEAIDL